MRSEACHSQHHVLDPPLARGVQVLPTAPADVITMVRLAGCAVVEDWADLADSHWGTVIIAVKTHWLPGIALEMSCSQARARSHLLVTMLSMFSGMSNPPLLQLVPRCQG
jgi:hypothetical protein